jgi:hypothetical protein
MKKVRDSQLDGELDRRRAELDSSKMFNRRWKGGTSGGAFACQNRGIAELRIAVERA